jgi:hypothetical protein
MNVIMALLEKNKNLRLGHKNDWEEVLKHPFFSDIDP